MMSLMASFMKVMGEMSGNERLMEIAAAAATLVEIGPDNGSDTEEQETDAEPTGSQAAYCRLLKKKLTKRKRI